MPCPAHNHLDARPSVMHDECSMPDSSDDSPSDTPPKKRRFRLRYSRRSLLIFMLLPLACGCGPFLREVEETLYKNEWHFLGNIHYDRIQEITISGGAVYVTKGVKTRGGILGPTNNYRGLIASVEAGIDGGELNIGFGWYEDWIGTGLSVKASVLNTWNDPRYAEPNQTYIGASLDYMIMRVYLTVSHYWHIAGSDDEHDKIWSVGVGVNF